jgi:preprotein translocase subunit SecE
MAEQSNKKAVEKSDASKDQKKKSGKKKDGFFTKVSRFAKELRSEIKKIVWPTRKQVVNNTCVVGVVMLAVGGFIWIIDWIFAFLRGIILGF